MLRSQPCWRKAMQALTHFLFSKWNYIGILLIPLCGFMPKLDRNEVWNVELGFKNWTGNHLFFFCFKMLPLYFWINLGTNKRENIYFPSFSGYRFWHRHAVITACVTVFLPLEPSISDLSTRDWSPPSGGNENRRTQLAHKVAFFLTHRTLKSTWD